MQPLRCLADDEIQALAVGALAADAAEPMLAHMGACDFCRALVATLARQQTTPPRGTDAIETLPRTDTLPILATGARVDRYVVREPLGRGGMGVVYAAYDPQLDRRVALKVVRSDRAQSPQLRQRLVREAQVMARVSHPNVVTVFDAGIVDARVFIAMELVLGSTLAEWLRAERRSWRSVVARFVDAGRGLAAAHALGIVHRDFKPDNVLVGRDGRVRVSDFGLAIAEASPATTEDPGGSPTSAPSGRLTRDGRLVGTPAYMAPEQRSGGVVDARTDQFSFCVALQEALFGARPGASPAPGVRCGTGRVPAGVRRAIARGLSPSPAARHPSMDALLERLEGNVAGGPRRLAALLAVALAAMGAAGAAVGSRHAPHDAAAPRAIARSVHRLTYTPGCEEYPSLAANSGLLVFDGEVDGASQLFTLDLASRTTRQLTFAPGAHRAAVVSPDGRRVAYEHRQGGPREIRLKTLDRDGEERSVGPGTSVGASWLDDHRLVTVGTGTPVAIDVDAPGAAPRPLHPDPAHHAFGLTASFADGTLAGAWWAPPNDVAIGLLSPSGTRVLVERMPYTDGALQIAPSQDALYYVRRAGAANELVRLPRQGGPPQVVQGGIAPARGLAIARDGARLVFSTCASYAQLARIGDGSGATPLFRRQPWTDSAPAPIDGHRVLFSSDRSGHDQLYVAADTGEEPRALSSLDVEQGNPSPDGRWVVYAAHDPGGLWVVPLDGKEPPRRVTDGARDDSAAFSRDGATIYFVRDDAVFAVGRDGGAPRRVADGPTGHLATSLVDDRVFFLRRADAPSPPRIMVIDGRGAVQPLDVAIPPGNDWSLSVAPDGQTLAMVHEGYEVLEVPLDGRGPAYVRARMPQWISSLSYTFDGKAFLASLEVLDGDLWIAEGEFP